MGSPVAFVLVGTKAPGNVGAVCRLAKAFGFPDVRLVAPEADPAADEARWLAHGAEDVLAGIGVHATLADALADCHRSSGATARVRHWTRPIRTPDEMARAIADSGAGSPWAIVLGPEDHGLSNDDLARCDEIVRIPMPPPTGATLSLPMAASILAWEVARAHGAADDSLERHRSEFPPLDSAQLDRLVDRIGATLDEIGFDPRPSPRHFRGSLRDFLARARPTVADQRVLVQMFAQVTKWKRRLQGEWKRSGRA
ncbi:MAG: TrmH family RNA methyltransferase [bacterium]